jgi:hypothetical protein
LPRRTAEWPDGDKDKPRLPLGGDSMLKDVVTRSFTLAILLVLMPAASPTSRAGDEPLKPDELMKLLKESRSAESAAKPKFKQDGDDLVITLEILINGCADVHSTSWKEYSGVYYLHYSVVQNLDSFIRSVKEITLEWRLKNHKMGNESKYPITAAYWAPTNDELKASEPELKKLIKK